MRQATILLLAAAGIMMGAVTPIEQNQVERSTAELSGVALNAAAGSRTFTIPTGGRSEVTVYIKYTRGGGAAATHITMTCLAGPASDVVYEVKSLERTTTPGTSSSQQHTWQDAVAASENIRWVVTPLNDEYLSCTIAGTSANANDVLTTVKTRLGVL